MSPNSLSIPTCTVISRDTSHVGLSREVPVQVGIWQGIAFRWSTFTINQTDFILFQNKGQQQWLRLWWCCHYTAVGFLQPEAELQALTWSTGSGPGISSLKTAYLWRTWNPLSIQEQSIIQDFNLGIQYQKKVDQKFLGHTQNSYPFQGQHSVLLPAKAFKKKIQFLFNLLYSYVVYHDFFCNITCLWVIWPIGRHHWHVL